MLISATVHTQASWSLICCSLASLSSADSVASRSRWRVLICCSLASLSSTDSVASRSLICCSLASLSSADSVASRSLICCSLASLSSANSVASWSRLCCRSDYLRSTVWAARLALSLILRLLSRSSLCTAVSESQRSLSRSRLRWRSLSLLSVSDSGVREAEARSWFVAEARWWFVELILQITNVETYSKPTVERYSNWLESRADWQWSMWATSWSSCGLTRRADDGRTIWKIAQMYRLCGAR